MKAQHFFKFVLLFVLNMLLLAGCSQEDLLYPINQSSLESLPPQVVQEMISKFSQELNLSTTEIKLVDIEQVTWPDTCLGVSQEGTACARAATPGYQVKLEANGNPYEYHSNQDGTLIIQANMDMHTNFPGVATAPGDQGISVSTGTAVTIETQTPALSYWTVFISESDQEITFNCEGIELMVNGSNNTLTLLGICPSLTVKGNGNWISIQSHPDLLITDTGDDNAIIEQ